MRKIIITSLLLVFFWLPTFAQVDASSVIAEIQASGEALKSFECDFLQKATNPMMKQPMISKGRMFYLAPSCVRWEYAEPAGTAMVLNGSKAMMSTGGKTQVVDLNSQKGFSQMIGLMTGIVHGSMLGDGNFDCDVDVSDKSYTVTLSPRARALKKALSRIVIVYDRAGACVSEIELHGKGGESVTVVELLNMKKDIALSAEIFKVE